MSSGDNTPTQPNLNGLGWVEWKFGLGLGQIFESYVSLGSNPIHLIFKKKKKTPTNPPEKAEMSEREVEERGRLR